MSIYTYKFAKQFSEVLGIEFHENVCVSDQELYKIPEESIPAEPWNKNNPLYMGENNPMFERSGDKHFFWGRTHTDEAKQRISAALVERMKDYEYKTVECPHCGKRGGINNMNRYHFDKCKSL